MDRVSSWITVIERHSNVFRLAAAPAILVMIGTVYLLVYYTGGIKYVYSHSMYIPIILSGFIFGARGGVAAGILGGIALGPFMPIDVTTGESQELLNWLYRMFFFIIVGLITGAMVSALITHIKHVEWLAHHDYNTNLPNRLSLIKALEESGIKEDRMYRSLMVLSIENLQNIIAGFGLESADRLVSDVVRDLSDRFPDSFLFFHHHPQHIAILAKLTTRQKITDFMDDILEVMKHPYEYENVPLHLDVRIGCVYMADKAHSPTSLINRAEYALSEARQKVHDYDFYDESIDNKGTGSLALLGSLRKAMEKSQLELHYQPKVDMNNNRLIGVEALLRWNHPDGKMIPPGMFIPHAENSSLIQPLSEWVLETALKQLAEWKRLGLDLKIAVNISTRNLLQSNFDNTVMHLLDQYGVHHEDLELEVTETSLMHNPEEALTMLNNLSDSGISIAIDDFGTGYSSLQYLNTISASVIKIDQSFIRDLAKNNSSRHIIESAIALGHSLDFKVVSEGIESGEDYTQLGEMGCDFGQGYFIARPMPADQLAGWMEKREENV
ncbi:MAG: EAL domain-containing protein [Gammaproteobacteria bacterium]